ncbi:Laminin subunit alpha-2 [Lamellibrachia satsuma]|nr:Laminin subunit alpha-2 [Lamellibrachia satsuma]
MSVQPDSGRLPAQCQHPRGVRGGWGVSAVSGECHGGCEQCQVSVTGVYEGGGVCEQCQVSVTGVYEGGGVCQQCPVSVTGVYEGGSVCQVSVTGVYEGDTVCQPCQMSVTGVYEEGRICQQCQVSVTGVYEGGKHHTMGINCELCADGYYRPRGIDQRRPDSCQMCLCDGPGSIGLCVKDSLLEYAAIYAGDCLCREGYCGPRCGECSPGYKGFPQCAPCPCDRAGSVNLDICDDTCVCKPRVCGNNCDICLQGFYNLQTLNYQGCDPCFCFGISHQCQSSIWGRMKLQDMSSWTVTDLAGSGYMFPARIQGRHVHMIVEETKHLNRALYWAAPEVYLGNKVTAYGGILDFKFSFSIDANISKPDSYLANHDIILEGSGVRIGIPGRYYDEVTQHIIIINMTEAGWCHLVNSTSPKGMPVSRDEFMLLLGRIERLLIRASFHIYETEKTLYWVNMDVASEWGEGAVMAGVEMCLCPPGYTGTSCESCAPGFRRTGNILYGGVCEPCRCHSHSYTCDSITGECLSCTHNTQGAYCEECAFGYYGNATDATPGACRPCACPLPVSSNNFAQGCVATPGSSQGEYMCIECPDGYMGNFCEICEPGYYGDPMLPGSSCQPCNCNGNSPNGDTCNPITGQCYDCLGKTQGSFCERCQEGYYGSAVNNNCKVCDCYSPGSVGTSCDYRTGQCSCRGHFAGQRCHRCQDGYGRVDLGCVSCGCDLWGSVTLTCDIDLGQCECKPGVEGMKCNQCQQRHYGFSSSGCRRCLCHARGATDLDCHPVTGQCQCKPRVRGQACDECMVSDTVTMVTKLEKYPCNSFCVDSYHLQHYL